MSSSERLGNLRGEVHEESGASMNNLSYSKHNCHQYQVASNSV
jgi:hypothetical protein